VIDFAKSWIAVLTALLLAAPLAGCINLTEKVEFSLNSYRGETNLNVSKDRLGFYANPHGGNSDDYKFIIPQGLNKVNVNQIMKYFVNYQELSPSVLGSGSLSIKADRNLCELTISIFDEKAVPHPLNGTYKQQRCGQLE